MAIAHPSTGLELQYVGAGPVVGIDEVGRGALAGPLYVGAVVFDEYRTPPEGLADSKTLSPARREALDGPIRDWAQAAAVGAVSAKEIDSWGLRVALAVAADRSLVALGVRPVHALIDGNLNLLDPPSTLGLGSPLPPLLFAGLAVTTVVRGDASCATIAAASIIAKVARDRVMGQLALQCALYGWERNMGYGTPEHLEALRLHGASTFHRQSWKLPLREQ